MDKVIFENAKSILLSYEGITDIDHKIIYENIDAVKFCYKNKEFYIIVDIEPQEMPMVYTSYQQDYPHYLPYDDNLKLRFICLFENIEYINSIIPLDDKIKIVIEKLLRLENLSQRQIFQEYLKEFTVYWNRFCFSKETLELYLSQNIDYVWLKVRAFELYKGAEKNFRLSDDNVFFNDLSKEKYSDRPSALFVKIQDTEGIFPPLNKKSWDRFNILKILSDPQVSRISDSAYNEICSKSYSHKNITLVFEINGFYVACDIEFKNGGTAKLIRKLENDIVSVTHRTVKRCDYTYLSGRIGNDDLLSNKKILLIGYGSLGSYVADEIVKCGCTDLSVYDNDCIEEDNICRYKSQYYWRGCKKASFAQVNLNNIHPQINVKGYCENFGPNVNVDDFDLVVSTVGSSDTQIMFNKIFNEKFINKPVVYCWLEGDGESSHALCTFNNNTGCYNCCFIDDEGNCVGNLFNKTPDKDIQYLRNCCGGVRAAYGTSTLLSASLIALKTIKEALVSNDKKSFVYHFTNGQVSKTTEIKKEGCELCGGHQS